MSRVSTRIFAILAFLPLLLGAVGIVAFGASPEKTWTKEEATGAPTDVINPSDLVDARRAAGEAGTQAGFLATGADELKRGVDEAAGGMGDLTGGLDELRTGTAELADGMNQIQAGTGQLGRGATELADGVGQAVDSVTGLAVVQGQLIEAIDHIARELETSRDPRAGELREQVLGFRGQVEAFDFTGDVANQLTRLKDGSRELANQLAVPGYAYHDGIYTATKGAKELNARVQEAAGDVDGALGGVDELVDGTTRLAQMAEQNKNNVTNIQRAIPAVQVPAAAASSEGADSDSEGWAGTGSQIAPMYALLIAALAVLGGVLVAWGQGASRWALGVGTVLAGVVLYALVSAGVPAVGLAVIAVALALLAAASAGLTALIMRWLSGPVAATVVMLGAVVQVGLVGWVWKTATSADVPAWATVLSGLMPLHYGTSTLSAVGNDVHGGPVWLPMLVLALVAALAGVALRGAAGKRAWRRGESVEAA